MRTIEQAAAQLQSKINSNDRAFRRRTGADAALGRLRSASAALVHRTAGDRVDLLLGRRIGGRALGTGRDSTAVQAFVDRFYRDHHPLFSAIPFEPGSLRVERVRSGATMVAEVGQYVDGVPVADSRWTMIFDRNGGLTNVMGAPYDPAMITVPTTARKDAAQAVRAALEHESLAADQTASHARLVVEGRGNRLVWVVRLRGRRSAAASRILRVDAHRDRVLSSVDARDHGTVAIPVTHYSHPGGVLDSSASLTTTDINVDATTLPIPPITLYSLERIGSGRSRIWNAKSTGVDSTPVFERTVSTASDYFTKQPGSTPTDVFNEQQTYAWAQSLKTAVDEWGREPNDYGYYPVEASRAVNVEIVVNSDAANEEAWGSGVNHGFFLDEAPGEWFRRDPADEVPAVFLFNSAGNSASPQFFGPETSSSYSIIAHEVGHFISWQYGGFEGAIGTKLGRSLREGFSMVLAALYGKHRFGTALSYTESRYVTTGGDDQWAYVPVGASTPKYSDLDCDEFSTTGNYELAFPFVRAMWRLMNNSDVAGQPIWGSADAAVENTADLVMYAMYCFTADTTMTWDKLCLALTARVFERVSDGVEKEPINGYDAYCAVVDAFAEHGLLQPCKNS